LLRHGGGVSLAAQYLFAQVAAGIVPSPKFADDGNSEEKAQAAA
jgi:hypothetical protein